MKDLLKPYEIPLSQDSLIGKEHPTVDYSDAFEISIPKDAGIPPEELVKLFFECIPSWAKLLLGLRELAAKMIGLKTADRSTVMQQIENFTGTPGESIALFHVKQRSDTEILTGEQDKHLDFSLSFIGQPKDDRFEIVLATTVLFNGWLGKLYFLPVKPIHRILVPAMLKRMAKKLVND